MKITAARDQFVAHRLGFGFEIDTHYNSILYMARRIVCCVPTITLSVERDHAERIHNTRRISSSDFRIDVLAQALRHRFHVGDLALMFAQRLDLGFDVIGHVDLDVRALRRRR